MKKLLLLVLLTVASLFVVSPSVKAQECTEKAPAGAPKITRVERNNTRAILYINPAGAPYTEYVIAYGFNAGDERFGETFKQASTTKQIIHTISNLDPLSTYFFRVRAGNLCKPGAWSDWFISNGAAVLQAETSSSSGYLVPTSPAGNPTTVPATLPEAGTPPFLMIAAFAVPALFVLLGLIL